MPGGGERRGAEREPGAHGFGLPKFVWCGFGEGRDDKRTTSQAVGWVTLSKNELGAGESDLRGDEP